MGEDVTEKAAEKVAAALPVGGEWVALEDLAARAGVSLDLAPGAALWLVGPWGDDGVEIKRGRAVPLCLRRVK
jgi:hypothetical protein